MVKILMFVCNECGDEYKESEIRTEEELLSNDIEILGISCPSCKGIDFQMYYEIVEV